MLNSSYFNCGSQKSFTTGVDPQHLQRIKSNSGRTLKDCQKPQDTDLDQCQSKYGLFKVKQNKSDGYQK